MGGWLTDWVGGWAGEYRKYSRSEVESLHVGTIWWDVDATTND